MTINIKKRHLIITGLILFGIAFFINNYNTSGNSEIDISFQLNNLNDDISFDETQIILSRIEEPWLLMQRTMQIADVSPNQDGIVSFKLKKSKSYLVGIYTDNKETSCGGIFFDTDTLSQNQTIVIPIKRIEKINLN